jgi:hypothetical protein
MSVPTQPVIPGREGGGKIDVCVNFSPTSEPGIHNPDRAYGFRACATPRRLSPTGMTHPGMTRVGFIESEIRRREAA